MRQPGNAACQLKEVFSPVVISFSRKMDLACEKPNSVLAALLPILSWRRLVFRGSPSAMAVMPCTHSCGIRVTSQLPFSAAGT